MISPLPLATEGAACSRRAPLLALPGSWPATLAWMGVIALCLAGLAAWAPSAWSSQADEVGALAIPAPALRSAAPATARARCSGCGVVETVRRIEPVGTQAPEYEFTVRLRDGSARVSRVDEATAAAWSVGDRIMLVGGT